MLLQEPPRVVSLISPVNKTVDMATQILKMEFPLILEKPPSRNLQKINKLSTAAKQANVFVRVAFNRRCTPLFAKLKDFIKYSNIYNITYQMYRKDRRYDDFSTTTIHNTLVDSTEMFEESGFYEETRRFF